MRDAGDPGSRRSPPFLPREIYGADEAGSPARVFIAPGRYIQGVGALDRLGIYLAPLGVRRVGLLLTEGGHRRHGARLRAALEAEGLLPVAAVFAGEPTLAEVERVTAELDGVRPPIDALLAAGGGKCLDVGKCVAHRLSIPLASVPTIASTDAPCSACSVLYTDEGGFAGVEHFPENPALVVVDTGVIARAPARYLVAGMGDALSTRYEARTCYANPEARTQLGARMTVAAMAIADASAATVLEHGTAALAAIGAREPTEALERVVEANTLLSGVGFEGGGIAAAHALATSGLPAIPRDRDALHGELVAIGLLTQLLLEGREGEARRVAEFMASVGLPVHLRQVGHDRQRDEADLARAAELAATAPIMAHEPFAVTPGRVLEALLGAHELGLEVARSAGDAPFRALREEGPGAS